MPSSLVTVLDKLLANKPHDRYQTAGEAAEALQALVRPKRAAGSRRSAKKPAAEAFATNRSRKNVPAPPPEPGRGRGRARVSRLVPPMARLAEQSPASPSP